MAPNAAAGSHRAPTEPTDASRKRRKRSAAGRTAGTRPGWRSRGTTAAAAAARAAAHTTAAAAARADGSRAAGTRSAVDARTDPAGARRLAGRSAMAAAAAVGARRRRSELARAAGTRGRTTVRPRTDPGLEAGRRPRAEAAPSGSRRGRAAADLSVVRSPWLAHVIRRSLIAFGVAVGVRWRLASNIRVEWRRRRVARVARILSVVGHVACTRVRPAGRRLDSTRITCRPL